MSIRTQTAGRWRPPPVLVASAGLHLTVLTLVVSAPRWWPWLLLALAFNHLALGLVGLWPRSRLLGPNLVRLPAASARRAEVALTFDDGPDPTVTPRVLDLLEAAGARASFFCIGQAVAAHPALAREIVQRGHDLENHSFSHPAWFAALGLRGLRRELADASCAIARASGHRPRFFRAPMGLRSPLLSPVLWRAGVALASWSRRGFDGVNGDADAVLRRLTRGLAAGDILLLHDGRCARTPAGDPVVLQVLPRLLARLQALGLRSVPLSAALGEDAAEKPRQPQECA